MNCPKCNSENDEASLICKNCGFAIDKSSAKRKVSKLAIISFVLGILSLLIYILPAIPAIICSIISLRKIRKSEGSLKGKGLSIAGLSISLISTFIIFPVLLIWRIDAPPIPNDYTTADLRSAPPEYNETFQLLKSFEKDDYLEDPLEPNGISSKERTKVREIFNKGTFQEIRELILSKSEMINDVWIKSEKSREIINQLNSYPQIADLTEPSFESLSPHLGNLRQLALIYRSYIFLQTELGNSESAAQTLIEFDSFARKFSLSVRALSPKLVNIAMLAYNIKIANYIANNPRTGIESIELLSNHFKPLTNETVSLRHCFINEYLMFKNTIDTKLGKLANRPNILLKRNSTLRVNKNFCDSLVSGESGNKNELLAVWPTNYPSFMPKVDIAKEPVPFVYKCYNPVGALLVRILTPAYDKVILIKTRLTIEDDLLQIVLNKRLNRQINLKARAYSNEYIIDVNDKKIVSPGPDGKIGTDDDITLPIEPEVLNLIKKP